MNLEIYRRGSFQPRPYQASFPEGLIPPWLDIDLLEVGVCGEGPDAAGFWGSDTRGGGTRHGAPAAVELSHFQGLVSWLGPWCASSRAQSRTPQLSQKGWFSRRPERHRTADRTTSLSWRRRE